MANRCDICGKGPVAGNNVSHSHKKTKRTWQPNLQTKTIVKDGVKQKVKICTRCLRTYKAQVV